MFDFDLRALAAPDVPERAYLSLYLASPDDLGLVQQRFRQIRAFLQDQPAEREHFEQNAALVAPYLDAPFQAESRAVFACWAADFAEAHELPVKVATLVRVDDSPYIRPLAELEDEYEDFAVVVADNRAAEVFFVSAGALAAEKRVRGDVKNRVKKGGWSQKRYARRREKALEHYAADVAEALEDLHREQPFERLVVLGSDEAMQAVEAALSTPMRGRVVGERAIAVGAGEDAVERAAFALYADAERAEEQDTWARIRESYLSHGLAVTGATDVLRAAREGRVETMLVARDADIGGSRCRACGHLAHGRPATCYVCGTADLFNVDLVNELVELAATTGADVDFAEPFEGLAEVGHVAALLRY